MLSICPPFQSVMPEIPGDSCAIHGFLVVPYSALGTGVKCNPASIR